MVNTCRISLSNINPVIVRDIASRMSELSLENMQERKDKFISNIYKARIDRKILFKEEANEPAERAALNNPKGLTEKERQAEVKREKEEADLYWCDACEKLMTQEQAMKVGCVEKAERNDSTS